MSATSSGRMIRLDDALHGFRREGEEGSFDTGRYNASYLRWGEGPPLVFVHGLGENTRSSLLPMTLLSRQFECIAYRQPSGRGDRSRLKSYTHNDLVEDLFAVLDHFELRQATLIGHSFGSTIVLRAMHQRPARIQRAVLVGGFAHRPLTPSESWLARIGRYLPGQMREVPYREAILRRAHHRPFAHREKEVWDYFLEHTALPSIRALSHWALSINELDLRPLLPGIHQPVLVMQGDQDVLVPYRHAEHLFQSLPNATMFLVEGCGHFPMFTHPEAMAHTVSRFAHAPACHMAGAIAAAASDGPDRNAL